MPGNTPPAEVMRELEFERQTRSGDRGKRARRIQEWLTYHGFATPIDSEFGSATEACVRAFQGARGLPVSGVVDEATWQQLVSPLAKAVAPVTVPSGADVAAVVLRVAEQHLAQRPTELGGDNRGPWVRAYMGGNEGPSWRWCAGFVTFAMKQACAALDRSAPIAGSHSCDSLAHQARSKQLFVTGRSLASGDPTWSNLGSCQIFLVRRSASDWTHTGFSFEGQGDTFSTIEGNTNDEGSSNGFELCRRTRSVRSKDFIRFPP